MQYEFFYAIIYAYHKLKSSIGQVLDEFSRYRGGIVMKNIKKDFIVTALIMFILCVFPAFYFISDKRFLIFWCPFVLVAIIKILHFLDATINFFNTEGSSTLQIELKDKIDAGYYDSEIINKIKEIRADYDFFNNENI